MGTTTIEWTDRTWNPVTGCRKVSPGCKHCYAEGVANRFWATQYPAVEIETGGPAGTMTRARAFTDVMTHEDRLLEPLSWRKPARVFVNSMSDLFHEDVPDAFIDQVFAVMAWASWHTFQVLTKRADRMRTYFAGPWHQRVSDVYRRMYAAGIASIARDEERQRLQGYAFGSITCGDHQERHLPNVWLGVSIEDQPRADERIRLLMRTPAAVRFVSAEPLLGPVNLREHLNGDSTGFETGGPQGWQTGYALDWVIVGGESGPGARPFNVAWARAIVRQCQAAGVPVFLKQLGVNVRDRNDAGFLGEEPDHWPDVIDQEDRIEHDLDGTRDGYQGAPVRIHLKSRKGGDPAEWPEDLRVRQFPGEARR